VAARTDISRVTARRCALQDAAATELDGPHGEWRAPRPVPDLRRAPMVGQSSPQDHWRDEPLAARLRVYRLQARPLAGRTPAGRTPDDTPQACSNGDGGADGSSALGWRPAGDDVRSAQARRNAVPERRHGRFSVLWSPFHRPWWCQTVVHSVLRHDQGRQAVSGWRGARVPVLPATPASPIARSHTTWPDHSSIGA
jgi:hypothetical protein